MPRVTGVCDFHFPGLGENGSIQSNPTYDSVPSYALYFFHFFKEQPNVSVPIQRSEVNLHVYFWTLCLLLRCWPPPLWWSWTGSNRRPPACKAGALPTELQPLFGSPLFVARHSPGDGRPSRVGWWVWMDSNHRPPPYQDGALTS